MSREDINRHPGSLLHSLAKAAAESDAADRVVRLHSSSSSTSAQNGTSVAPNNPLLTLPGALKVTTALYRSKDGKLCLDTLSRLLALHDSPGAAYTTLDALIDFLLLPGPVSGWLPPADSIPLPHIGVADLHMYPTAQEIVGCMLRALPLAGRCSDSQALSQLAVSGQRPYACLYIGSISTPEVLAAPGSVAKVQVYQLTGAHYTRLPAVEGGPFAIINHSTQASLLFSSVTAAPADNGLRPGQVYTFEDNYYQKFQTRRGKPVNTAALHKLMSTLGWGLVWQLI